MNGSVMIRSPRKAMDWGRSLMLARASSAIFKEVSVAADRMKKMSWRSGFTKSPRPHGGGKGFVGSHCGSDTFHTPGKPFETQDQKDPYIAMLGGEFIRHGEQQKARMTVVDPKFPGMPQDRSFEMHEEWYSLKNFAPDLHVLLVNETTGMKGKDYERPRFPATWARLHGKGRVFYTSMGHREDVWTNPVFQSILMGGIKWAAGQVEADVTANISQVTPGANVLPSQ